MSQKELKFWEKEIEKYINNIMLKNMIEGAFYNEVDRGYFEGKCELFLDEMYEKREKIEYKNFYKYEEDIKIIFENIWWEKYDEFEKEIKS